MNSCSIVKDYGSKDVKTCKTDNYFVEKHEDCKTKKIYDNWKDVYKSVNTNIEDGTESRAIQNAGRGVGLTPGWNYTKDENICKNVDTTIADKKKRFFIGTYPVNKDATYESNIPRNIDRSKNMYDNAFYYEYLAEGKPGNKKIDDSLFNYIGGKKSRRKSKSSKKSHRKSSKKSHRKSRRGGKSRRGRR